MQIRSSKERMNNGRIDNKLTENLHFQITDGVIYVAGTWKLDVYAMMKFLVIKQNPLQIPRYNVY